MYIESAIYNEAYNFKTWDAVVISFLPIAMHMLILTIKKTKGLKK